MVGHFATRLEVEAGRAGGSLTPAQIRAFARHFVESGQARFAGYYRRAYDDCTRTRRTQQIETARSMPFDRILMRRIAPLFPPREGDEGGSGVLSRRIVPGFHLVIDKVIGPTRHEACRAAAEAIVARHTRPGGGCDWAAVYADAEARLLANEILVAVALSFTGFEKRRAWLIAMIDDHLAPAAAGAPDEHFRFGESAFSAMMRALFADLAALARHNPRSIRAHWGDHTFAAIEAFLLHLDRLP
jgi:hypothetical protein